MTAGGGTLLCEYSPDAADVKTRDGQVGKVASVSTLHVHAGARYGMGLLEITTRHGHMWKPRPACIESVQVCLSV